MSKTSKKLIKFPTRKSTSKIQWNKPNKSKVLLDQNKNWFNNNNSTQFQD